MSPGERISHESRGRIGVRGEHILLPEAGAFADETLIVIEDARIIGLAREAPSDLEVLDFRHKVLMPGLIDAHTHVLLHGNLLRSDFRRQILEENPSYRVAHAVEAMQVALSHGFTTIRDLETEGASYADVGLRDAAAEGVVPGPRMLVAGPAMSPTGTYPIVGFRPDWPFPVGVDVVDGADACRRLVREQVSRGVDWIKVYANAGAGQRRRPDGMIEGPANWTTDEFEAIVDEAHRLGRPVAAHATSFDGVSSAVAAGVDSIEHGYSITKDLATEMARKNIALCPTIVATKYCAIPRSQERGPVWADAVPTQAASFKNCLEAGVKIAFGTDAGCFPWTEINQVVELSNLTELGMATSDAIRSITVTAAEVIGADGVVGTFKAGAVADIVGLASNPLEDVARLAEVEIVMKEGRLIHGDAGSA